MFMTAVNAFRLYQLSRVSRDVTNNTIKTFDQFLRRRAKVISFSDFVYELGGHLALRLKEHHHLAQSAAPIPHTAPRARVTSRAYMLRDDEESPVISGQRAAEQERRDQERLDADGHVAILAVKQARCQVCCAPCVAWKEHFHRRGRKTSVSCKKCEVPLCAPETPGARIRARRGRLDQSFLAGLLDCVPHDDHHTQDAV